MRIMELEDVLVLVDQMPREKQFAVVQMVTVMVEDWEAQQAEGVGDSHWERIKRQRFREKLKRMDGLIEELGRLKKKPR